MSVQEIELAIQRLSSAEMAQFSAWFATYIHQRWDAEVAGDLDPGRLDGLLEEVEREYKAGHARPL